MHATVPNFTPARRARAIRMAMILAIVSLYTGSNTDIVAVDRNEASATPPQVAIKSIASDAMKQYDLKSIIVQVTVRRQECLHRRAGRVDDRRACDS